MQKSSPKTATDLLISLALAIPVSAVLAAAQPHPYLHSWLSTGVLLWLSFFLGIRTWRFFKGGRTLAILLLVQPGDRSEEEIDEMIRCRFEAEDMGYMASEEYGLWPQEFCLEG